MTTRDSVCLYSSCINSISCILKIKHQAENLLKCEKKNIEI